MKTNKEHLIKFSLYLDKQLKKRIDEAYKNYCDKVASESELMCKPISLSSWLENVLNNSDIIGGAAQ